MAHRGSWSKTIYESGFKVRLYERDKGAAVYFSFVLDGRKVQRSTKLTDRRKATGFAKDVVREIAERRRTGWVEDPTLGAVFAEYFRHRAPMLREYWKQAAEGKRGMFEHAWGKDARVEDIGHTCVERYSGLRRTGELAGARDTRKPRGVRDGAIDSDFRWLSSVFNWACKHKQNGKRLLALNPLNDIDWPKEKNPRRPVASHERYMSTRAKADEIDPGGRLKCALDLAWHTGRRESAIIALRVSDILRSQTDIKEALASQGLDESRAEHMPHGAIRWRDEHDKQGYDTIAPLNRAARASLDTYLMRHARVGEAWLFPAPKNDTRHMRRDLAGRWLLQAERLAELPKLSRGLWHPYRRAWATARKHMPDADVAAAGGWRDVTALRLSYQHADPETTLRVVEETG